MGKKEVKKSGNDSSDISDFSSEEDIRTAAKKIIKSYNPNSKKEEEKASKKQSKKAKKVSESEIEQEEEEVEEKKQKKDKKKSKKRKMTESSSSDEEDEEDKEERKNIKEGMKNKLKSVSKSASIKTIKQSQIEEEEDSESEAEVQKKQQKQKKNKKISVEIDSEEEIVRDVPEESKKEKKLKKQAEKEKKAQEQEEEVEVKEKKSKKDKKKKSKKEEKIEVEQEQEEEIVEKKQKKDKKKNKKVESESEEEEQKPVQVTKKIKKQSIDSTIVVSKKSSKKNSIQIEEENNQQSQIQQQQTTPTVPVVQNYGNLEIMIKGLPYEVTEEQIKKFIGDACPDGQDDISKITLLIDRNTKKSRGTGFATLKNKAAFDKVIAYNGTKFQDREIKITNCATRQDNKQSMENQQKKDTEKTRTVFVGNLTYKTSQQDLLDFFKNCGKIRTAQICKDAKSQRSRGYGYIDFYDGEGAQEAIKLTGKQLDGREVKVDISSMNADKIQKQQKKNEVRLQKKQMNKIMAQSQVEGSQASKVDKIASKIVFKSG